MKIMWILAASLGAAFSLTGQTFTGEVRDAETREPIAFANVYFTELHTGTTTDEAGTFTLENYPKRKISFQISYLGYEELTETIDLATQNHHVFLLHPAHFDLEEVVVSVPVGKLQEENVVRIEQVKINELTRA
ncbi:MAG: carboxypeptidase-like regulatory domain-containing protein, partial [Bacteroidetes bacterium]